MSQQYSKIPPQPRPVASPHPGYGVAQGAKARHPSQAVHNYPAQQARPAAPQPQGIFISRKKIVWTIILVLVIAGGLTAFTKRERPAADHTSTLGTSQTLPGATQEAQGYYNEISPHVEVPTGEAPTVLNVSDADAVKKDNAALTDIKNGDKMLFFTKSRKLVVYRPGTKKVIAVVSLAAPTANSAPTTTR